MNLKPFQHETIEEPALVQTNNKPILIIGIILLTVIGSIVIWDLIRRHRINSGYAV